MRVRLPITLTCACLGLVIQLYLLVRSAMGLPHIDMFKFNDWFFTVATNQVINAFISGFLLCAIMTILWPPSTADDDNPAEVFE